MDDYVARQTANDLQYRIAYAMWFDELPPDEQRKLKAMGLDKYDCDLPKPKSKKKWNNKHVKKTVQVVQSQLSLIYTKDTSNEPPPWV